MLACDLVPYVFSLQLRTCMATANHSASIFVECLVCAIALVYHWNTQCRSEEPPSVLVALFNRPQTLSVEKHSNVDPVEQILTYNVI